MPKLTKQQARDLTPNGWIYIGTAGKFYEYQTGDYNTGFRVMRLLDCDMIPEVIAKMIELNLTR